MRLNKYLSQHTELSRRKADVAIANGRVGIDGRTAILGDAAENDSIVTLDGEKVIAREVKIVTVILHKPAGYVCSKNGQGSKTVYSLLPKAYAHLNIAGRLDKDSSGLVVLTNSGELLQELTHPSQNKEKLYIVTLDKALWPEDSKKIRNGVDIGDDRLSTFKTLTKRSEKVYEVILEEGRNRQIRRTFEALGYEITKLHRVSMGRYSLGKLKEKEKIILQD